MSHQREPIYSRGVRPQIPANFKTLPKILFQQKTLQVEAKKDELKNSRRIESLLFVLQSCFVLQIVKKKHPV